MYIPQLLPGKTRTVCAVDITNAAHVQCNQNEPKAAGNCTFEWRIDKM
jgi:hypothetical protein